MIVKPAISFLNRDSDPNVLLRARVIMAGMTGNPNYPAPTPGLDVVGTAVDEFATAMANAADGGKSLTSAKNNKRKALAILIRALACYVAAACNGDYTVLLSSGFPTHKTARSPIGNLPKPVRVIVTLGFYSGELDASVEPVSGALLYSWRVTTGPSRTVVQTKQTSATSTTFAGLTPGVIYFVEANVVGTAGPSDWTGPASRMVV
jgi:hypothetical protein